MIKFLFVQALFAAISLSSCLQGQTVSLSPVADERVLCDFKNALSHQRIGGMKDAKANVDPATRSLKVILPKAESGVGISVLRGPTRLDPMPYLEDVAPGIEITFRGEQKALPEGLYIVLETLDLSVKPAVSKRIKTQVTLLSSATQMGDGWQVIRLTFESLNAASAVLDSGSGAASRIVRLGEGASAVEINSQDAIEKVQLWGKSAGSLEIAKISLVRARNVSANLVNNESLNTERLEIFGETVPPDALVTLKMIDAQGAAHEKKVQASDGRYSYTWEAPPVTTGKSSVLHASINSGKRVVDQAVSREVFGYYADPSHAWLKVKGREIVTSPMSEGGERPFYSVGAGYCKDVIVRGYDEEVAAYSKAMGLNTLRLAFYTTNFNNRADLPLSIEDIIAFIDPVLKAAKRHGLYVILDDHTYFKNEIDEEAARGDQKSGGWTEERFNHWVKQWVKVAEHYKDEPYILGYELCNEPVCSPETARKWYLRCLEAIRAVDERHIIILGTHNWSHARAMEATWTDIASTLDAPHNNVVFSFHDYPFDNNPWEVQSYLKTFQDRYNVPVMCTEFGGGGKPEPIHREFQAGMLSLFAYERIHWMVWALSYNPELAKGFPTQVQKLENKEWKLVPPANPGYWIPFVELWAPTARIMGSPFPSPAVVTKN